MRVLILLLTFAAGCWMILWGSSLWGYDDLWPAYVAVGVALIVGTIVSIRRKGRQLREDLLAGKDIVARWQVSQANLTAFHEIDQQRGAVETEYRNFLRLPKTVPPEGLPIIIGKRDWMIGSRLYRGNPPGCTLLCNVATLEGDPGYIEIAMMNRRGGSGWFMLLIRLPVPIAARGAARLAASHLADRVPEQNHQKLGRYNPNYVDGLAG